MKKYHPLISSNLQILTLPLITLLAFALVFTCTNCNKEDDTQPKHNTFRCKVNGQDWEAFDSRGGGGLPGHSGVFDPTDLRYYSDTRALGLTAVKHIEEEPEIRQGLRFSTRNTIIGSNTMIFKKNAFGDALKMAGCQDYRLDTLKKRELIILNIDTNSFIMEGTFEFSAHNDCGDTVHITDGYFDLDYRF